MILGLGKPVGDGVNYGGIDSKTAVAAFDFDILGLCSGGFQARLPRDDAIRPAENGCARHRRRRLEQVLYPPVIHPVAAQIFVEPPRIG